MNKKRKLTVSLAWPPGGQWISPTVGALRQSPDAGRPQRGRKKRTHPILEIVRKSFEKRKLKLVPKGPHNRFVPFHTEFAMLFLAAYSPYVVVRLLKEVWAGEDTCVPNTLGKVSKRTIEHIYEKIENQFREGGLVDSLPRAWLLQLAKHELGPWHPRTPRWLTEVFSKAEIQVPLPEMHNRGRAVPASNKSIILDTDPAVERIIADDRKSRLNLTPNEKNKALKKELNAIRKLFPTFTLSEDERLIAWDLGLSAVREHRAQAKPAVVESSESSVTHTKRKDGKTVQNPKDVAKSGSGSAREATDHASDSTSKEKLLHAASVKDGSSMERKDSSDKIPLPEPKEIGDLGGANEIQKIAPTSCDHSAGNRPDSPDTRNPLNDCASGSVGVARGSGRAITGRVHRFEVLGLPSESFGHQLKRGLREAYWNEEWQPDYAEDVAFPNLKARSPEEALESWRNFDFGNDKQVSENSWIPRCDPKLIDLVERGCSASLLYGNQIPAQFQSVLFCWIVERIIAWVLDLEVHHRILDMDNDFIPEVHDFFDSVTKKWLEQGNSNVVDPMTPLLNECFRPAGSDESQPKKFWVPGWGAMEFEHLPSVINHLHKAAQDLDVNIVTTAHYRWSKKVRQLLRMEKLGDHRAIAEFEVIAHGSFHFPICTNYTALAPIKSEWVDLSEIQDFWKPQPGEEGVAAALGECKTRLHMPSILMIEQALEQRARKSL